MVISLCSLCDGNFSLPCMYWSFLFVLCVVVISLCYVCDGSFSPVCGSNFYLLCM